jgi:WD40 repeat protein
MRTSLRALLLLLCLGPTAAAASQASPHPGKQTPSRPELYLSLGHTDAIDALAWSPDGLTLATGGRDHRIVLWNTASGKPRATLSGHHAGLRRVVWSQGRRLLASLDWEGVTIIWDGTTGKRQATLGPSQGFEVTADIAWSPDGKILAAGGGSLVLWDADSGRQSTPLRGAWGDLLAWSPDGKTLATAGGPKGTAISLWDMATDRRRIGLSGKEYYLEQMQWSPDGKHLAAADDHGAVILWEVATRMRRQLLPVRESYYKTVPLAWSPDGHLLATGSSEKAGDLYLWDPTTGEREATLSGHKSDVTALAWSPDGSTLASTDSLSTLFWDAAARKQRADPDQTGRPFAWSPDGKTLAAAAGKVLILWDGRTGKPGARLTSHGRAVRRVQWSPDGTAIAASSDEAAMPSLRAAGPGPTISFWQVQAGKPRLVLSGLSDWLYGLAWNPNGQLLAVATGYFGSPDYPIPSGSGLYPRWWQRNAVGLYDASTGKRRLALDDAAAPLMWHPDGKRLVTGSTKSEAVVWEATASRRLAVFPMPRESWTLEWSPDGKALAIAEPGPVYTLWDVEMRKPRATITPPPGYYSTFAWSPNGATIAIAASDHTVGLYDPVTGTRRHTLVLRSLTRFDRVGGFLASGKSAWLAWRPDGRVLATAAADGGTLKLWDAQSGRLQAILATPTRALTGLAWSPYGRTVAAAIREQHVVLWDPETRNRRATLRGHTGALIALAWRPDSQRLATGSEDGSVRLWSAATGRELAAFYSIDDGKEWLAHTPDGFFTASPGAARLIQWRQGSRLWPAAKFRRFERPDRVRRALTDAPNGRGPVTTPDHRSRS